MNKSWRTAKLGTILQRVKDEVLVRDDETYARLTIRMNGKGIVQRDRVPGIEIGTKRQFVARAGQLVLSKIDARNGAFGILTQDCDNAIITGNFWAFDANPELVLPEYVGFLTKTRMFIDFCIRASEGTTNRRYLQEDDFLASNITLPPMDEQRRVVARIEEAAVQIREARTLREESICEGELLLRSILAHDKLVSSVRMNELVRLRATDVVVQADQKYDFAGIYCFGRGMFRSGQKSGMEFAYQRLTRVHAGDFVYPKLMAWEGALAVVPAECDGCVVSPEFPVFVVNEARVFPEVLDVYFRTPSVWPKLSETSTGTNVRRRRLNPQDFLAYEMPLPSRATQVKLKAAYAEVEKLRVLQSETAVELDALLPSVLSKAFSGEL